jgi:hypothetical protein
MILAVEHLADAGNPRLAWMSQGKRPAPWLQVAITGATLILALLSFRAMQGIRIDSSHFAFPARAVALMDRAGVEGNLLVDFDWGEYVIWHLGPRVKVSIDGRRETVYSSQALARDLEFREARPGWRVLLQTGDPNFALLRRGSPCEQRLREEPGWKVAYEDRLSTLLVRQASPLADRISQSPAPDRLWTVSKLR